MNNIELDKNLIYGLNWKARTDAEVKLIADSDKMFSILGAFHREFQEKSLQDMASLPVSANAQDVSEKIHNAKYAANAKMFYTFSNLSQLAKQELDRRFKARRKKVVTKSA